MSDRIPLGLLDDDAEHKALRSAMAQRLGTPGHELKSWSRPWYEAIPSKLTDMFYGENAGPREGASMRHLFGTENPLNVPGRVHEGFDRARQGVALGQPRDVAVGALQMSEALPFASGMMMAAKAGRGRPSPLADLAAPSTQKPIPAYHSSPHRYDEIDMSKIGSGEGLQAFGHGYYTAGSPDVAAHYDRILARRNIYLDDGQLSRTEWPPVPTGVDMTTPGRAAARYDELTKSLERARANQEADKALMRKAGLSEAEAIQAAEYLTVDGHLSLSETLVLMKAARDRDGAYAKIKTLTEDGRLREATAKNTRYDLAIHSTPNRMLHLDQPVSKQPVAARRALQEAFTDADLGNPGLIDRLLRGRKKSDPKGMDLVKKAIQEQRSKELSEIMSDYGVDAFRYRNGLTRGRHGEVEPNSYNYVILDANKPSASHPGKRVAEILRKYGLGGLMAGGAAQGGLLDGEQPQ